MRSEAPYKISLIEASMERCVQICAHAIRLATHLREMQIAVNMVILIEALKKAKKLSSASLKEKFDSGTGLAKSPAKEI